MPSDALLPAVSEPDRTAMPSPARCPGRALTEQVEPTPSCSGRSGAPSAAGWRAPLRDPAAVPVLRRARRELRGGDSIGLPGAGFPGLGWLGFQGGPAVVRALAAGYPCRRASSESPAALTRASIHTPGIAPRRTPTSRTASLSSRDSQAARALQRAGTEVPLDEVRVERDRLTKVAMAEGEIVDLGCLAPHHRSAPHGRDGSLHRTELSAGTADRGEASGEEALRVRPAAPAPPPPRRRDEDAALPGTGVCRPVAGTAGSGEHARSPPVDTARFERGRTRAPLQTRSGALVRRGRGDREPDPQPVSAAAA